MEEVFYKLNKQWRKKSGWRITKSKEVEEHWLPLSSSALQDANFKGLPGGPLVLI